MVSGIDISSVRSNASDSPEGQKRGSLSTLGQSNNGVSRFQAIFDHAFQFMWLLRPDGLLLEVNQTALDFVRLKRDQVMQQPLWQTPWWAFSSETGHRLRRWVDRAAQGKFIREEVEARGVEGQSMVLDFSLRPIVDEDGSIGLILLEGRDIRDRKQIEAELEKSRHHYASLAAASPVGIFRTDPQGDCLYVNQRWCEIAGMSPSEAMGKGWLGALYSEDYARVMNEWYEAAQANRPFKSEYRFESSPGSVTWIYGQAVAEYARDGSITGYVGTITDINERKQLEIALAAEKEIAQVTLHSIGDAVITTDALGQVRYLNPVAEQMTGWSAAAAQGRPILEVFHIIHETTRKPAASPVEQALARGVVSGLANHTILICRNGQEYSIEDSAAPIRDAQGQTIGVVIVFHDVTRARHLSRQLSWQATHDLLTQLHNRRYFEAQLEKMVGTAVQLAKQHVLCYLDLDQFKVVNDTGGHSAGDELLRQLSRIIQGKIRATDTLARLGGDEFGILLDQCPLPQAIAIAEDIRQAIADFHFIWQDSVFRVGVSIGLVSIDSQSTSAPDVLSAADAACYGAKYRGRNRIQVYQKDNTELIQQRQERHWSVLIHQALEQQRFCLHRQRIVPAQPNSSQTSFYEVLVRMIDQDNNLVSPGVFIPAAERYGLMPLLDRWIIRTCFAYLASSEADSQSGPLYSINLSGTSIDDDQFLSYVKQQFNDYQVSPQRICFEITETAAIADFERATSFMRELKRLGCRFALDDFGSGMSSFAYLKSLPVDFLKIDGSFMRNVSHDATNQAIVESIHRVGSVMGLQTIAEFVEDSATLEQLCSIGINFVQGYGVDRPEAWL